MKKLILLACILYSVASCAQAPSGFTKLANVTSTTYSDSTCPNQTSCYYAVTAVDATGHESPSAQCAGTQLCFGGNQAVAIMPSSGTHTVSLSWTASTSTGVTYNVYQHIGPFAPSGLSATVN